MFQRYAWKLIYLAFLFVNFIRRRGSPRSRAMIVSYDHQPRSLRYKPCSIGKKDSIFPPTRRPGGQSHSWFSKNMEPFTPFCELSKSFRNGIFHVDKNPNRHFLCNCQPYVVTVLVMFATYFALYKYFKKKVDYPPTPAVFFDYEILCFYTS